MVKGIGGSRGLPFDTMLIVDPAPTLLSLLVRTLRARIAFVVESGIGVLLAVLFCIPRSEDETVEERLTSTSSEGDDSMTLSNLVDRKPEAEETLNPPIR
jgi:hypothetical protein